MRRRTNEVVEVTIDDFPAILHGHYSPGIRGARDVEVIGGKRVVGRPIEPDDPPSFTIDRIKSGTKGGSAEFLRDKLYRDDIRNEVELQIGEQLGLGDFMLNW